MDRIVHVSFESITVLHLDWAGSVLSIVGTGLAASLVPGWRAWRMSLADGLTPRN